MRTKRNRPALTRGLLGRMAEALKVLGHADRLAILDAIASVGEAPVHGIVEAVGLPQGTTSMHLNKMRVAGLLAAERRGREVWYRVSDPHAVTILDCIRKKARNA